MVVKVRFPFPWSQTRCRNWLLRRGFSAMQGICHPDKQEQYFLVWYKNPKPGETLPAVLCDDEITVDGKGQIVPNRQ